MLDPKVAKMVSKELEAESIIVFDEAHNVRTTPIVSLSLSLSWCLSSQIVLSEKKDFDRQRPLMTLVRSHCRLTAFASKPCPLPFMKEGSSKQNDHWGDCRRKCQG